MFDSHAHVLSRDTHRFPPVSSDPAVADFLATSGFDADDLIGAMDAQGVSGALIVQRGQYYGSDNSYVCASAARHPERLTAVCGINGRSPDCASQAALWFDKGAAGLRLMGRPDETTLDWLQGEHASEVWRACADRDRPLCIHLFPAMRETGIAAILAMQQQYGLNALVIDHFAATSVTDKDDAGIDDALRSLAECPEITLKFTTIPLGYLAERDISSGAIIDAFLAVFGEDRLIWGSDITQSGGTYAQMVALGRDASAHLATPVSEKLLGANTRRIYRIG